MLANIPFKSNLSNLEIFILEIILELTHPKTLDTYRVKYNNPNTILSELYEVLQDWKNERIKSFETVVSVKDETKVLITEDKILKYNTVTENYFKELLEKLKDKDYEHLFYCTKLLIEENANYLQELIEEIKVKLKTNNKENDRESLYKLTSYLIAELINKGVSKTFIHEDVYRLIIKGKDFNQILNCISKYIITKKQFQVYFKCFLGKEFKSEFHPKNLKFEIDLKDFLNKISSENSDDKKIKNIENYLNEKRNVFPIIIGFEAESYDQFSAIKNAKDQLTLLFDNLKLGFPELTIDLYHRTLVIDNSFELWPAIKNSIPSIDGRYKSGQNLYNKLSQKIDEILDNKNITNETKEKITASIRHLRQGNENLEIEQKFLNYWIGLEYLFSNYDKKTTTFKRIKNYFPAIHSIGYIKRNLREFISDLNRVNKDLNCKDIIKEEATYDDIINKNNDKLPLLSFRANQIKKDIFKNRICDLVKRHKCNLEYHIARMYRIRNEIVHEAAKKPNIESITSNLRFYLTFILNSLIDFLHTEPMDVNQDGKINIEDFFILKEIEFKNLEINSFNLEKMLDVNDIEEIFS